MSFRFNILAALKYKTTPRQKLVEQVCYNLFMKFYEISRCRCTLHSSTPFSYAICNMVSRYSGKRMNVNERWDRTYGHTHAWKYLNLNANKISQFKRFTLTVQKYVDYIFYYLGWNANMTSTRIVQTIYNFHYVFRQNRTYINGFTIITRQIGRKITVWRI